MLTILVLCSTVCTFTGVRMIWSVLFGARRKDGAVPGARLVRDGRGEVAEHPVLPAIARVVGGAFLIVIGVAVVYITEIVPR